MTTVSASILDQACTAAGIGLDRPVLLRDGENAVWRANADVVARISRPGQISAVEREVQVAKWLALHDFPAVRLIAGLAQPTVVDGHAVTFWQPVAPHRMGSVVEVAHLLRRLHDLPQPTDFDPGRLEPFVRLQERISASQLLTDDDRSWLLAHLADLDACWADLPDGLPHCVVHGDAWIGNVVVDEYGNALMMDLERAAIGPPEWDLVSTAIKVTSFGWVSPADYEQFVAIYGVDVVSWAGFALLRDIRELRMTTYLLQRAAADPRLVADAQYRVDCLRGRHGPRPWPWTSTG